MVKIQGTKPDNPHHMTGVNLVVDPKWDQNFPPKLRQIVLYNQRTNGWTEYGTTDIGENETFGVYMGNGQIMAFPPTKKASNEPA